MGRRVRRNKKERTFASRSVSGVRFGTGFARTIIPHPLPPSAAHPGPSLRYKRRGGSETGQGKKKKLHSGRESDLRRRELPKLLGGKGPRWFWLQPDHELRQVKTKLQFTCGLTPQSLCHGPEPPKVRDAANWRPQPGPRPTPPAHSIQLVLNECSSHDHGRQPSL